MECAKLLYLVFIPRRLYGVPTTALHPQQYKRSRYDKQREQQQAAAFIERKAHSSKRY